MAESLDNKRSLHTICPSVPIRRLKSSSNTKFQDSILIRVLFVWVQGGTNTSSWNANRIQLIERHLLNVIELSFVKHNLHIHERTLNLPSLLWPELSINHEWGALVSDQHKSQFLDCHKWNRNNLFTISEIYRTYTSVITWETNLILGTKEAFIRQQQQHNGGKKGEDKDGEDKWVYYWSNNLLQLDQFNDHLVILVSYACSGSRLMLLFRFYLPLPAWYKICSRVLIAHLLGLTLIFWSGKLP